MKDYQVATIIRSEPNPDHPGVLVVTVACPLCGRTHTHGATDGPGVDPGHRAAHCGKGGGYLVQWPKEVA